MPGFSVLVFIAFPPESCWVPAQNDGRKLKKHAGLRVPKLLLQQPDSTGAPIKVTGLGFSLVWSVGLLTVEQGAEWVWEHDA